jgi:hypothetical protein
LLTASTRNQLHLKLVSFALFFAWGCGQKPTTIRTGGAAQELPPSENFDRWQRSDPLGIAVAPIAPEARLLQGAEFSNSVQTLLGIQASTIFSQADTTAGFSNGAGLQMDESLFSVIGLEIEKLSTAYVQQKMLGQYPCFQQENPECAESFVRDFAGKAFRRPLSDEEVSNLLQFYRDSLAALKDPVPARELLISRILLSPQFLYRTEVGHAVAGQNLSFLTDFEIASLISYTLTGDMPDAALQAEASSGNLSRETARIHITRILASEKSQEWLVGFFKHWLMVEDLDLMAKDPSKFPKLPPGTLGQSLRQEFHHFIRATVFTNNATLPSLLLEPRTYINGDTAALYGKTSSGTAMQAVDLDATQRRGILTLASVMAVHSSVGEAHIDSPIMRGTLIYDNILCNEPLTASGVDTVTATQDALASHPNFQELTVREQHEAMMEQDPSCQGCHVKFMPFGFLYGNFDALGSYKNQQQGKQINTSVSGVSLDGKPSSFTNAVQFTSDLAKSETSSKCFSTQLARYIIGKYQAPDISTLLNKLFTTNGLGITTLLADALTSPELYLRKAAQ